MLKIKKWNPLPLILKAGHIAILHMRSSITVKLFFFICCLLLITILPLFLTVERTFTRLEDYLLTVNTQQIKAQSDAALSALSQEQAQRYDSIFFRLKTAAALLAQSASNVYGNIDLYSRHPVEAIPLERQIRNQIFYTPRSHPIITAYWGDSKISPEIEQEIRALSHLGPHLKKVGEMNPESIAVHIITTSGIGRYYTTDPMAKTQCYRLPSPGEFDLRDGEPVRVFTRQEARDDGVKLTAPYKDDVIDGFMITATAPIIDKVGRFRGIAGVDIPLAAVLLGLTHQAHPRNEADKDGIFSRFILDKAGRLIGYPHSHFDLFNLEIDPAQFKYSRDVMRFTFTDAKNSVIKKALPSILSRHSSLTRLRIDGEDYAFSAHSLEAVGWHLVLVSRDKSRLASLAQTREIMEKSMAQISTYYQSHTLFILCIAVFIIFLAVKVIVKPIKKLTGFAERLSEGDRSMASPIDRKDEIGVLENRFDQMLKKLIVSEKKEKNNARLLEKTITDRTKALHASNRDLVRAKEELESMVAKRTAQLKLLNEHLVYSEEIERRAIAADLHDTIAQTLALSISKIKTMNEPDAKINSEELFEIQDFLEQTSRGIRSLIYKLSPPILDDFDIDIALGFLIEGNNDQHDAQLTYINRLEDPVDLEKSVKIMLYRATAELITNLFKYAGTKKAEIEISCTDAHISVRVEDKGVGMNAQKIMAAEGYGFGLYYISQRVENFGGRFVIDSKPGQGTKIMIRIPVAKEA